MEALHKSINKKLLADFEDSVEYSKQFDYMREIFEFNMSEYGAMWEGLDVKHKILQTRKSINICNGWNRDINRMRAGGAVGSIYVESRKLKNTLLPITENFLNFLKGFATHWVVPCESSCPEGSACVWF